MSQAGNQAGVLLLQAQDWTALSEVPRRFAAITTKKPDIGTRRRMVPSMTISIRKPFRRSKSC